METANGYQLVLKSHIGPVSLGMKKEDLRKIMSGNVEVEEAYIDMELGGMAINASDYFEETGIKVEYDSGGLVIFIEIGDFVPVWFESVSLFELNFREIFTFFRKHDRQFRSDESGFNSEKLGVAVYAPEHEDDPKCKIELISIFIDGYMDE